MLVCSHADAEWMYLASGRMIVSELTSTYSPIQVMIVNTGHVTNDSNVLYIYIPYYNG